MPSIDRARLTSGYGWQDWRGYLHTGIDLAGLVPGQSVPVRAAAGGVVVATTATVPLRTGPQIQIRHPDGTMTTYGHARNVVVRPGDVVKRGQQLADSWHTGLPAAAGIHLHFEHWTWDGDHTTHHDPTTWLDRNGWTIRGGRLYDTGHPTITPASTTAKEWADMATKDEVKTALREVLAETKVIPDNRHADAFRIGPDGRQEVVTKTRYDQGVDQKLTKILENLGVPAEQIAEIHAAIVPGQEN